MRESGGQLLNGGDGHLEVGAPSWCVVMTKLELSHRRLVGNDFAPTTVRLRRGVHEKLSHLLRLCSSRESRCYGPSD